MKPSLEPKPGHGMRVTAIVPVFVTDKGTRRVCGYAGRVVTVCYNGYEFDTPQAQGFAEAVGRTGKVDVIAAAAEIVGHHAVKQKLDHHKRPVERKFPPFYGV